MTPADLVIYKLLLWALPILLAVLAFIGAWAVGVLSSMNKNITEIKIHIATHATTQEDHEKRLDRIENIILVPKKV